MGKDWEELEAGICFFPGPEGRGENDFYQKGRVTDPSVGGREMCWENTGAPGVKK